MANPTYIACLTPPGKAAIATLAVRGPLAWQATGAMFTPRHGPLPESPGVGQWWLGQIGEALRDDVIVAIKRDGPDTWIEIHCHGGPAVLQLMETLYTQRGVLTCTWQELERLTAGPDWQVAAQEWLVQAPTARTAAILLDQYEGAFQRALAEIVAAPGTDAARSRLARLVQLIPLGRHLVQPWSVVIGGAPNVGKSSLVNALAGYTRSVVAPTPGTTRDVVTIGLAIDGWPVALSDTAGLRRAEGAIEHEGIARARQAAADAELRIWLLDGSVADPACVAHGSEPVDWQVVINKADLPAAWDWSRFPQAPRVSALTGAGIAELCAAISTWLVPVPPAPGEAVPYSPEACNGVERASRGFGVS
jgi:tRNA modification GTPase